MHSSHLHSRFMILLQPRHCLNNVGLGSSPFARHYLGNHFLFSLPAGTKMFQFPALASILDDISSIYRVAPFGNPRINGYLLLPVAYRSLSRPSSPPRAKASAMRPSLLSWFDTTGIATFVSIGSYEPYFLRLFSTRFFNMSKIFILWRITDSNR